MTKVIEAKPSTSEKVKEILHPLVREWFFGKFPELSLTQKYGVLKIWERKNILISAHGNSVRALAKFLEKISDEKISQLEIRTGEAWIYKIDKNGKVLSKEIRAKNPTEV